MSLYANWLDGLAWFYVGLSLLCALVILFHEFTKPQKMFIMNLVWPLTALYRSVVVLWAYFHAGQRMTKDHQRQQQQQQGGESQEPSRTQVAVSVTHCGAGCTRGDITAESMVAAAAITFVGEFPTRILLEFLLAWFFGVIFQYQYFTIVPMRGLSPAKGVLSAIRADMFSIVAFQMGLFGWMVLSYFGLFTDPHLQANQALFWFMMQIGMILGFFTSYPANVFLLRKGWKEKMG